MTQEERLIQIKKMLKEQHQLSTRKLAEHFNVAFDTARRDVLRLTSTGQAVRIHGGLMEINRNNVPDFMARSQIQSPIKEKMAKMAKRFVHPGQYDFVAPSTTLEQMCQMISGQNLQIVTNSIDNAFALMNSPLPNVTILGGDLNKEDHFISSTAAIDLIRQRKFNTAFIGTSKVRNDGIYTANEADAEIVSAVVHHSMYVILIAEKYKFTNNNSSPYLSAPLDLIDVVITDTPLSEETKRAFSPNTQIIPVLRKDNYD